MLLAKRVYIGGQLQNKDFRLFVDALDMDTAVRIPRDYLTNKKWFHLNNNPCILPKSSQIKS